MADGPVLASELQGSSLQNLCDSVLLFRTAEYRSELLEMMRSEGIGAPSDLAKVTEQAFETKFATHASANFMQLADMVSLRRSAEQGATAEQGGRGDRDRSRSNGRDRRRPRSRDDRRRRQDDGRRGRRGGRRDRSRSNDRGSRGDRQERPRQEKPELWAAVEGGEEDIVRLCLSRGDDAEEKYLGWSPLMKAAEENNVELMRLLLEKRVDLEVANRKGRTALSFAAAPSMKRTTALAALKLLLEHGADMSRRDDTGLTPKEKAEKEERQEAVMLLEECEMQRAVSGQADAASEP